MSMPEMIEHGACGPTRPARYTEYIGDPRHLGCGDAASLVVRSNVLVEALATEPVYGLLQPSWEPSAPVAAADPSSAALAPEKEGGGGACMNRYCADGPWVQHVARCAMRMGPMRSATGAIEFDPTPAYFHQSAGDEWRRGVSPTSSHQSGSQGWMWNLPRLVASVVSGGSAWDDQTSPRVVPWAGDEVSRRAAWKAVPLPSPSQAPTRRLPFEPIPWGPGSGQAAGPQLPHALQSGHRGLVLHKPPPPAPAAAHGMQSSQAVSGLSPPSPKAFDAPPLAGLRAETAAPRQQWQDAPALPPRPPSPLDGMPQAVDRSGDALSDRGHLAEDTSFAAPAFLHGAKERVHGGMLGSRPVKPEPGHSLPLAAQSLGLGLPSQARSGQLRPRSRPRPG
jgi:hypothetical protein